MKKILICPEGVDWSFAFDMKCLSLEITGDHRRSLEQKDLDSIKKTLP